MSLFYFISTILTCFSVSTSAQESYIRLYISKSGRDRKGCGNTVEAACGTLHYTSSLLPKQHDVYIELYVYDGQHKNDIRKYLSNNPNNTNPCLPGTDLSGQWYDTLTFNPNHIRTMTDWFSPFCQRIQTKSFFHRYHYYSNRSIQMTINNLIINDFNFTNTALVISPWVTINNLTITNVMTSGLLMNCDNIFLHNININRLYIKEGSFILNTVGDIGIYASTISNLHLHN
eukprot:309553_1